MSEPRAADTSSTPPTQLLILRTGSLAKRLPQLVENRGDCDHMFVASAERTPEQFAMVAVHEDEEIPLPPTSYKGVLITGSAAMVSSPEPWMEKTAAWLRQAVHAGVPVLGVCFGHQLLAYALGGKVGQNPQGPEAGSIAVEFGQNAKHDALFGDMPQQATFNAHHYETVLSLPKGATILAQNETDRHQAVRYAPNAWGTQFHPEIDAEIMLAIMDIVGDKLDEHGVSSSTVRDKTVNTPNGSELLKHYFTMVLGQPNAS